MQTITETPSPSPSPSIVAPAPREGRHCRTVYNAPWEPRSDVRWACGACGADGEWRPDRETAAAEGDAHVCGPAARGTARFAIAEMMAALGDAFGLVRYVPTPTIGLAIRSHRAASYTGSEVFRSTSLAELAREAISYLTFFDEDLDAQWDVLVEQVVIAAGLDHTPTTCGAPGLPELDEQAAVADALAAAGPDDIVIGGRGDGPVTLACSDALGPEPEHVDFWNYGLTGPLDRWAAEQAARSSGLHLVQVHWATGEGTIYGFSSREGAESALTRFEGPGERCTGRRLRSTCVDLTEPGCGESWARLLGDASTAPGGESVGTAGDDPPAPPSSSITSPRVQRLTIDTDRREVAIEALTAACTPYGSLPLEIPALMLEWAGADYAPDTAHQIDTAHRLLAAIRGVDCDQCSALTLGDFRAAVRTPTSGAEIEIRRYAGGWTIAVDFGPRGSHHRADQICDGGQPWRVEMVEAAAVLEHGA